MAQVAQHRALTKSYDCINNMDIDACAIVLPK
jgi:hypothetical protein